jgi:hypothetical protein
MAVYEVIIHTHVGRQYIIADVANAEEAEEIALRQYVEEGDDGEVLYEERDYTEVQALPTEQS